jgi:hypothetical protein
MPRRRRAGGKRRKIGFAGQAGSLGGSRPSRTTASGTGISSAGWRRAGGARRRFVLSEASGARSASGRRANVEHRKRRPHAAAAHLLGRRLSLLGHLRVPRARQDTCVQRTAMRLRRVVDVASPPNARGGCASSAEPSWAASRRPSPPSAATPCHVFPWSASKHVRGASEQKAPKPARR